MRKILSKKRIKASIHRRKNTWQIQEAKAKFSQVVEEANQDGYQTITKQGKPVAIIMSVKAFEQLSKPSTSLLSFFKSAPYPEIDLDLQRCKELPRDFSIP